MASQLDEPMDSSDDQSMDCDDRIDAHLVSALDAPSDDAAKYHLREALQLKLAEMHNS